MKQKDVLGFLKKAIDGEIRITAIIFRENKEHGLFGHVRSCENSYDGLMTLAECDLLKDGIIEKINDILTKYTKEK